jgi:hypothetical protein
MAGPAYWPIELYGDDAWSLRVEFTAEDDNGVAQPVDCTGRTYRAQVRATAASQVVLCEMDVDDGDADGGVIIVSIPQSAIRGLSGQWDMQEIIGAGGPTTLFAGPVTWTGDITR